MKNGKYFLAFALTTCFVFVVTADASPRVERRKPLTANVGVVSVGLNTYWKQCPGLYEDMVKKAAVFEKRIESHQVKVAGFGYGQRIKNRFFPFGAPESFFNALEVSQQPAASVQQPIRMVVARFDAFESRFKDTQSTAPVLPFGVGIEPTPRWSCLGCAPTRC